jgi:hypothetical protein
MNKTSNMYSPDSLERCIELYLGLESMEMIELLLDLCGATIDARALPLLKQRLQEEQAQVSQWEAHGYVRMHEKSAQLVAVLQPLILTLEQEERI